MANIAAMLAAVMANNVIVVDSMRNREDEEDDTLDLDTIEEMTKEYREEHKDDRFWKMHWDDVLVYSVYAILFVFLIAGMCYNILQWR